MKKIAFLVLACGFCANAAAKRPWVDLDATYIERKPHTISLQGQIKYENRHIPHMTENARKLIKAGLEPKPGEQVRFECHFVNRSEIALTDVECEVLIDGKLVRTQHFEKLQAGEQVIVPVKWAWQSGEHTIELRVDPQNNIREACEANNSRRDRIDGLGLRFFVTQRCYDDFNSHLNMVGSRSFEDWLQYHLAAMNKSFAEAIYPTTPTGCHERVRFDQLYVCRDKKQIEELKKQHVADYQGGWEFDLWDSQAQEIRRVTLDSGLCHELMHQLGVIDMYTFNCAPRLNRVVGADGKPILVGFYWADQNCVMIRCGGWYRNFEHYRFRNGELVPMQMWGPPLNKPHEHTACALNIQKGRPRGYFGDYLWATPKTVKIRVLDSAARPVADAELIAYQTANPVPRHYHVKAGLRDKPATVGRTDAEGTIALKNHPVPQVEPSYRGFTMRPNPFGRINNHGAESTMFIIIRARGQEEYRWLPLTELNLAYWRGCEDVYTVTYRTKIPPTGAPAPPTGLKLNDHTLSWQPSTQPGVKYRVYALRKLCSEIDGSWYQLLAERDAAYMENVPADGNYYAYVVTAVAGGKESAFSEKAFAPNAWRLRNSYRHGIINAKGMCIWRNTFEAAHRWLLSQVRFDAPKQRLSANAEPIALVGFYMKPGYEARFKLYENGYADGEGDGAAIFSAEAVQYIRRIVQRKK